MLFLRFDMCLCDDTASVFRGGRVARASAALRNRPRNLRCNGPSHPLHLPSLFNMIDRIIATPWMFFFLIVVLAALSFGAYLRVRRDRALRNRTSAPRRKVPRIANDRRWDARRKKS
jgi:hypothetical protein